VMYPYIVPSKKVYAHFSHQTRTKFTTIVGQNVNCGRDVFSSPFRNIIA